ncbi:uncharacterized protein LOC111717109 [Eurytemora carolleeae]|uniref:uncharacterized protein LOC111717109 n=1 Tax=Eurytemora carolleeae TaxID=1294199 RepID=UPI000C78570C|nr:uncharacterized protein LOC111717109 [Eurytemora carolleeae]|eukprot:XP_023348387.1 uncharacterized protein LOC111717109 [Eurytemora affinis]
MWGGGDNPSYDEDGDFDVEQAEVFEDVHPVLGVVVKNSININVNVSGSPGFVNNVSVQDKELAANVGKSAVVIEEEVHKLLKKALENGNETGEESGGGVYVVIGVVIGVLIIIIVIAVFLIYRNSKLCARRERNELSEPRSKWKGVGRRIKDGFRGELMTKPSQEGKSCSSTNIATVEDAGYLVPNNVLGSDQTELTQSHGRKESGLEVSDMKGRTGVANANFREREEADYEEVQVEGAGTATQRFTSSLEKPTSSAKIGIKVSLENVKVEDLMNHTYVDTEFGSTGFIERSLKGAEDMKGAVTVDMKTITKKMSLRPTDEGEELYSSSAVDWIGECFDGVREADGLDFTCASDDVFSERDSLDYQVADSSFIESIGNRVENAIKDIVFEKQVGMSRVQNALQDIGNEIRNEKEEVYDMLTRVQGLQDLCEETPRRSARLAKKRLEKENRP